ncbi:hypothetical protein LCGC14_2105370 [marine sediment metagenome]|uniref:Uncharacterized protein n=1 Tax=marine sediment metagenome TaxID=412755 RepID=A0A0F9E8N2_9ZZZZ
MASKDTPTGDAIMTLSEMIEDLERESHRLSDWESNFVDSISHRSSLTPAQAEKLQQIWDKIGRGK